MKGLILAGGLGTRMEPITNTLPKQLIPVANTPVIDYIISDLVGSGITEIGVVLGAVGREQLRDHLSDGSKYGAEISYIIQEEPKGPANAVKSAEEFIGDEPFVVYFGDTYIEESVTRKLVETYEANEYTLVLALQEVNNPTRYGVADFDSDSTLKRVYEKPDDPPSNLAYMGTFVLSPEVFTIIENQEVSSTGELEITETIDRIVRTERSFEWIVENSLWKDVGTPEDAIVTNERLLEEISNDVRGIIEDGATVNGDVELSDDSIIKSGAIVTGPVSIGAGTTIESDAEIGPYTSIGDNCKLSNVEIESSILLDNTTIDCDISIEESLIGQNVTIQENGGSTTSFVIGNEGYIGL
jgi:glucose-1-phosphate thymidylyltransferase